MKRGMITFLRLLGFLLAFAFVLFTTDPIVNLISGVAQNEFILSLITVLLEILGAILIVKLFIRKRSFKEIGLILKVDRRVLIYGGAGLVLGVLGILIVFLLGGVTFDRFIWDKFFWEDIIPAILIGVLHSIGTSAVEGITIRGYVFSLLSFRNKYMGVVLTAIIYVFINTLTIGFSPLPLIGLFLFSIFLSQIFLWTGNLVYSIIFHALWYFTNMYLFSTQASRAYGIIMLEPTDNVILTGGYAGIWGNLVFIILILVINIVLLKKIRDRES